MVSEPVKQRIGLQMVAPVVLGLVTLALGLVGIGWGLPSQERNRLYFHGRPPQAPQIPPEAAEQSWKYFPEFSWLPERRSLPENLSVRTPRSVFNPIRSCHPDEYVILKSISNMRPAQWDFDPKFFAWPSFFIYLVAAALKLAACFGLVTLRPDLGFYYEHPEQMARLYLVGRAMVCLLGAGAVGAVYALGKRLCDRRTGALAAVVTLLSPPFIVGLHAMTPEVPMVLFATLTLIACVAISQGGTARTYVFAGLFMALAAGCKYEAAYLAFAVLFAHIAGQLRTKIWRSALAPRSFAPLLLSGAVAAGVFALTNPYLALHPRELWWVASREVACVWATLPLPAALIPWHMMVCLVGAGALIFGVLGIFAGGRRMLPLALAVLLLYAFTAFAAPQYLRHYMIFLPFLSVFAVLPLYALHSVAGLSRRTQTIAAATVYTFFALGVILPLADVSAFFLRQFTGANTRDAAGEWIAANIPQGAKLALIAEPWQYTTPPLDAARWRLVFTDYDYDKLQAERPDYLVLSSADFVYPYGLALPMQRKLVFEANLHMASGRRRVVFDRPIAPLCRPLFAPGFTWPEDLLFANPRFEIYQFKWQ